MTRARVFHLTTLLLAAVAVLLQFVLVYSGHAVLDETDPPALGTRIVRFFSYLTIWSNILVAVVAFTLAFGRDSESRVWRVLRLDMVVLIAVVAVVHFVALRPLLDLTGADLLADRMLHVIVPFFAVVGWLVYGPRGRVDRSDLLPFLILPVGWLGYTLIRGEVVGWYPYPFIDVGEHGYPVVLLNCLLVAALMLVLAVGALSLDRRLPARTEEG